MRPRPNAPTLGDPEERCRECGRPLASDQRYCLGCGARRGAARLDFRAMLGNGVTTVQALPEQARRGPGIGLPRPLAWGMIFVLAAGIIVGTAFGPAGDPQAATRYVIAAPPAGAPPAIAKAAKGAAAAAAGTDLSSLSAGSGAGAGDVAAAGSGATAAVSSSEPAVEPSESLTPETPAGDTSGDGRDDTTTDTPSGPSVSHVFAIVLDGAGYETSFGKDTRMPYLGRELAGKGVLLTNYRAIGDGPLANRIALISGQPPNTQTSGGCTSFSDVSPGTLDDELIVKGEGCVYPADAETLASQLTTLGRGARAYSEDMAKGSPAACRHPAIGSADDTAKPRVGDAFAVSLSPLSYFHGVIDAPECKSSLVDLGKLAKDLAAGADAPAYAWIAPSLCHAGGAAEGCAGEDPDPLVRTDAFLKTWVPRILASKAYADHGLLFITFAGAKAERVGALAVSAQVEPGSESAKGYDHYSFLRSLEEIFGLGQLGKARAARVKAFGPDVFSRVR